jgi:hypothetical protein
MSNFPFLITIFLWTSIKIIQKDGGFHRDMFWILKEERFYISYETNSNSSVSYDLFH